MSTLAPMEWLRHIESERARYVRFARARLASDADAEDVVQRALLRAVTHGATLTDEERAQAWFFRVLRRAITDHHRTGARTAARSDASASSDLESLASPEPAPPVCRCGETLLGELPASYAEVLRRIDAAGEPVDEVARSLGISPANAYVRLHRARRALRAYVEKRCGVHTAREAMACDCHGCE